MSTHRHNIKVGDTFVLCDAGGGTVDLISYRVSALRPLLEIEEASPGSGSLCGSSFLNRIFQKRLYDKFKHDGAWDNEVLEEASIYFNTGDVELTTSQATKRFDSVVSLHNTYE